MIQMFFQLKWESKVTAHDPVSFRPLPLVLVLTLPLILGNGCGLPSGNTPTDRTIYKLWIMGEVAKRFKPDEVRQFGTLRDFLSSAKERNYIEEIHPGYYEKDGWGGAFQWAVVDRADAVVVEIRSLGRDGIHDTNGGDDLY